MNTRFVVIITSIVFLATSSIFLWAIQFPAQDTNNNQTGENTAVTSVALGLSFLYPTSWQRDTSQEPQKYITISNRALDLSQLHTIAVLHINAVRENPKHLDPTSWFNAEIAQNTDSYSRIGLGKIRNYATYTVVASELQSMRHMYIFSGDKVIEVTYPNDQAQFTSTYNAIVNSIQIR